VETDAKNERPGQQQDQRVDEPPEPAGGGTDETLLEIPPN